MALVRPDAPGLFDLLAVHEEAIERCRNEFGLADRRTVREVALHALLVRIVNQYERADMAVKQGKVQTAASYEVAAGRGLERYLVMAGVTTPRGESKVSERQEEDPVAQAAGDFLGDND